MISRRRLTWFGHVSRMPADRLPAKALHCYIPGRRSRGRPSGSITYKRTWIVSNWTWRKRWTGSLWSCFGQAISILLNLADHTSLLTCPVCFLWNMPKNSTLNIEIMRTHYAKWWNICSWCCKFDNLYVQSGAVIIILSFSFVVFFDCCFCLLV